MISRIHNAWMPLSHLLNYWEMALWRYHQDFRSPTVRLPSFSGATLFVQESVKDMFSPRRLRLLRYAIFLSSVQFFGACATGNQVEKADSGCTPLASADIQRLQNQVSTRRIGERIAFWSEQFVGTPYDVDPLGEYVRSEKVVCDYRVDCMYLVFRAVELAQANTPAGAVDRSLDLRFRTRGRVEGGRVVNYQERFAYAEDMIASGRWGRDITTELGASVKMPGKQRGEKTPVLLRSELLKPEVDGKLKTGDLIFFVEDPAKRFADEIIGHLGIIKVEKGTLFLIHASGVKSTEERTGVGVVKKVDLLEYLANMQFTGAKFTRFE